MSALGLGCAKTPALAPHVEISLSNCISGSQIILHNARLDALLENCVFYISRMYEFLHSQGQSRRIGRFATLAACPLCFQLRPTRCVATNRRDVPGPDVS